MNPLEKCARAICEAEGDNPDRVNSWEGALTWTTYVKTARACLEAIREPEDHVVTDVATRINRALWVGDHLYESDLGKSFTAMIDHILSQ